MINITSFRSTRKAYLIYAIGFTIVCLCGLVVKSFNDKIALMTGSVHSYQLMVDKQSAQLKAVSKEKDRLKRDLDENDESLKGLQASLDKLDSGCKINLEKLETKLTSVENKYSDLVADNAKLENKYKTLSKSNAEAIADIDKLRIDNKRLREQIEEANSSKASQLIKLRDSLGSVTSDREKFREQYTALFKQHQESIDTVQLLQEERDRLQAQIREIQKLSGASVKEEGEPSLPQRSARSGDTAPSSSAAPVVDQPRVMEEPLAGLSSSSSSSPSPAQELQGAEPGNDPLQATSKSPALAPVQAASLSPLPAASKPPMVVYESKPFPALSGAQSNPAFNKLDTLRKVAPIGAHVGRASYSGKYYQADTQVQDNSVLDQNFIKPFVKQDDGIKQYVPDNQKYYADIQKYVPESQKYYADIQKYIPDKLKYVQGNPKYLQDKQKYVYQPNQERNYNKPIYNQFNQEEVDSLHAPVEDQQQYYYPKANNNDGLQKFGYGDLRRRVEPANNIGGRQQYHGDLRYEQNGGWGREAGNMQNNVRNRDF